MGCLLAMDIVLVSCGQLEPARDSWIHDLREAVRAECIEGDFTGAIAAYRRALVSGIPKDYALHARYRMARVLWDRGRDYDARQVSKALLRELPKQGYLHRRLSHLLTEEDTPGNSVDRLGEGLRRALTASDAQKIRSVASALAYDDAQEAARILLRAHADLPPDDPHRATLLGYLACSEWPASASAIRRALHETDPAMIVAGAWSVGYLTDAESAGDLVQLLRHSDSKVLVRAALSLGSLRWMPATTELARIAREDDRESVRRAAAQALAEIGTAEAHRVLANLNLRPDAFKTICSLSPWYREAAASDAVAQTSFEGSERSGPAPRIGVVVSALAHHGWTAETRRRPYSRQVRTAWTLRRAGLDVCLLAGPDFARDPLAAEIAGLFDPPLVIHPLGAWPRADAVVVDELYCLCAALVRTLLAYVEGGGRVVVIGAIGSEWCGDGIALRRLVGVRRIHHHDFCSDGVPLVPSDDEPLPRALDGVWTCDRRGSFYAHDTLGGRVLATFDGPRVWAIKVHEVGKGRVLQFNWSVGLRQTGVRDEDDLFCASIDAFLLEESASTRPLRRMLQRLRRQDLSAAKACVDARRLCSMAASEKLETIAQLFRIYTVENNSVRGRRACEALLRSTGLTHAGRPLLEKISHAPRRLQLSLLWEKEPAWWLDVPPWLRPLGSVPLWLTGPLALPAGVRVRVWAAPFETVRVRAVEADLVDASDGDAAAVRGSGSSDWLLRHPPKSLQAGWLEFVVTMRSWDAAIEAETVRRDPVGERAAPVLDEPVRSIP